MRVPLWQGCNICKVCSVGPYSCWLFSMCNSIGGVGGVCVNVSYVLPVPYGYGASRLANIDLLESCAFQAICATAVGRGTVRLS
jgi:hypothetical protein